MSCQQVPTAPALKPYPRSVQVGEFEVAISGGVWVAIRVHTLLPLCMMAWTAERKASLKGPAAAAFASLLDQVMWHRFILPCQWAGIAILVVCSAIAVWKLLDRAEFHDEDVTFLSFISKSISRLIGS